jgi:hypothetical protein
MIIGPHNIFVSDVLTLLVYGITYNNLFMIDRILDARVLDWWCWFHVCRRGRVVVCAW